MCKVIKIRDRFRDFEFLGSRDSGETLRDEAIAHIEQGGVVEFDFEGIDGISHSFADEIFGLIVAKFGVDFIKQNIKLKNTNPTIKAMANFAIKERLKK